VEGDPKETRKLTGDEAERRTERELDREVPYWPDIY